MSKDKNKSALGGIFAGILGLGIGLLGGYALSKANEEEKEKEINELRVQVNNRPTSQSNDLLDNENLYCPISNVLMTEPIIVTKCGHTFQKEVIIEWIQRKKECPLCRIQIEESDLKQNFNMKSLINELVAKNKK